MSPTRSAWVKLPEKLISFRTPVLVAIAYYVGAQAAFAVGTLSDRIFAPFWPPNVVLFCALVLAPKRRWWVYIAATFPAHLIAEIGVGMPAAQLLVAFVTNCAVALLNAVGVRYFLRESTWFGTLKSASIFILITAGLGPGIAALGGAFVQIVGGGSISDYWRFWGYWYISNALGSVTLVPVVLTWFDTHSEIERLSHRRQAEAAILAVGLASVCAIVFHVGSGTVASGFLPALLYAPLPLMLWAAIRFGHRGASGAVLVVTIVSIWQNLREPTVFISGNPETNVLALQVFLLGVAVPVFFLGAVIDELGRTGQAMRRLAGVLLRAQDEERRRISRDLHDSTGQNLALAGFLLSRIQGMAPESCGPVIDEIKQICQQSMVEIRTVSYLLHPPLLDGVGLDIALRSFLDGFSKRTGIDVELNLPPDVGNIPASVELVLFRVIQEALTNVWRHSGSATARICLAKPPGGQQVTLSIEDFGKGIPNKIRLATLSKPVSQRDIPIGLGLVGMRERLHQVGGSLEIDSTNGKTVIRAIVKLNPPRQATQTA